MIFFHGHPESRRNVLADTKSLDFSMYTSISIKSAQSPLKCGDFCFPVLMFEDLPSNYFALTYNPVTYFDMED